MLSSRSTRGTRRVGRGLAALFVPVLLLVACGDDDSGTSSDPTAANDDNGGDEGSALEGDPVKVGVLYTLSGATAPVGERAVSGAEFWQEQVGDIEGVLGRPVELIVKDTKGTPDGAQAAARELIDEDGVSLVVGPFLSGETGPLISLFSQRDVLSINNSSLPDAGDPSVAPTMFRIEFPKAAEGPGFLQRACDLGASKIALIVVDNPLGTSTVESLDEGLGDAPCDLEIVAREFVASGATDASAQVGNARDEDADIAVVNVVASSDYITILKAMVDGGLTVPVIGNSSLGFPDIAAAVPEMSDLLNVGGYTANASAPMPAITEEWRDAYREFMGGSPLEDTIWNAVTTYDSLELIRIAAEGAGSLDVAEMQSYLEQNGPFELAKGTFSFSADSHDGLGEDDVVFVTGGTFEDGVLARIDD